MGHFMHTRMRRYVRQRSVDTGRPTQAVRASQTRVASSRGVRSTPNAATSIAAMRRKRRLKRL